MAQGREPHSGLCPRYSSKSMAKTYAKTVNVDLSDAAKIIKIATSVKANWIALRSSENVHCAACST
eukprot:5292338-Amphidinium_carterae.1